MMLFIIILLCSSYAINYKENEMIGKKIHFRCLIKKIKAFDRINGAIENLYVAKKR